MHNDTQRVLKVWLHSLDHDTYDNFIKGVVKINILPFKDYMHKIILSNGELSNNL